MPRSDASRNVTLLLTAARALLAADADLEDVPMDEVARRAGVGNATLYRHFPTRADLLVAVYADEVSALCRHGETLLTAPDPLDALFTWLDAFVVHVATKRSLALAATAGPSGRRTALFDEWHAAIHRTAEALTSRARPTLHPTVTATDLLTLTSGTALTATDPPHARHLTALLRSGVAM